MQIPSKPLHHGKRWRRLAAGLAIAVVLGGAGGAYAALSGPAANQSPVVASNVQPLALSPPPVGSRLRGRTLPNFTALVAGARPAVVSITTRLTQTASRRAIEHRRVAGLPSPRTDLPQSPVPPMKARGSGFIIAADGIIVTNNHLVAGEQRIVVTLNGGAKLRATVIGRDHHNDIALLKIDAGHPLPFIQLGNSRTVRPGQWVIAIGDPFGLGGSVTSGIVSGRQRRIGKDKADPFIQIDAPINPGNSGGPLLALDGRVLGMDTAILSPSGGSAGIGFAIPADLIRRVVTRLEADASHGRGIRPDPSVAALHVVPAHHAEVGLVLASLTPKLRRDLRVPSRVSGAVVENVKPGSLADIAGLQPGDVIVGVDLHSVSSPVQAKQAVRTGLTGSRHAVALRIIRQGRPLFVGMDRGRGDAQ